MGFDISFHPISEQQIQSWYFESLKSEGHALELCRSFDVEQPERDRFLALLNECRQMTADGEFDRSHGFAIAITQGFFATYYYVRGTALSFAGPEIGPYTKPWTEILPSMPHGFTTHDRISANYSSGVFVPAEKVGSLLNDCRSSTPVADAVRAELGQEHLAVLLAALDDAHAKGVGLLEASEVIEPNPIDLNKSTCYSNLLNCNTAGPLIYRDTALNQLASAQNPALDDALADGRLVRMVTYQSETGPPMPTTPNPLAAPALARDLEPPHGLPMPPSRLTAPPAKVSRVMKASFAVCVLLLVVSVMTRIFLEPAYRFDFDEFTEQNCVLVDELWICAGDIDVSQFES